MEKINKVLHLNRNLIQFHSTITLDQLINVPLLNGRFKIKWKFNNPIINNPISTTTTTTTISTTKTSSKSNQKNSSSSSSSSSSINSESSSSSSQPLSLRTPPSSNSQLIDLPTKSEPTGSTDYVQIKNHTVVFKHAFHCPISIELDKNGHPIPSTLTIIIKEEHVNEMGRRFVTQHGLIHINLTQYTPIIKHLTQKPQFNIDVNQSTSSPNSTRREKAKFLLKECKTNAHLKIQIQMDYIGGVSPFNILSSETHHLKGLSQQDDSKSIFSSRIINPNSPGSSIISDSSSQHMTLLRTRKQSLGNKSNKTNSSEPMYSTNKQQQQSKVSTNSIGKNNQQTPPLAMSSQIAQNVIDVIFSPYYPSSSPHPSFNLTSPSGPPHFHQPVDKQNKKTVKKLTHLSHSFL